MNTLSSNTSPFHFSKPAPKATRLSLTNIGIARIIQRMCRKIAALLLILGWISLSGFDVVEDLDGVPGQPALVGGSGNGSTAKLHDRTPLANNIVESATRIQHTDLALVNFTPALFDCDTLLEFRRHSQRHKLYHVFLV
jgi:hypothetical protein